MSYHRHKQVMPRIGPIRWRRDGFGIQVIWMSVGGEGMSGILGGEVVPSDPIQRGYVKVWRRGDLLRETQVVDRALTVKVARRRINQIKEKELAQADQARAN